MSRRGKRRTVKDEEDEAEETLTMAKLIVGSHFGHLGGFGERQDAFGPSRNCQRGTQGDASCTLPVGGGGGRWKATKATQISRASGHGGGFRAKDHCSKTLPHFGTKTSSMSPSCSSSLS